MSANADFQEFKKKATGCAFVFEKLECKSYGNDTNHHPKTQVDKRLLNRTFC